MNPFSEWATDTLASKFMEEEAMVDLVKVFGKVQMYDISVVPFLNVSQCFFVVCQELREA